MEENRKTTCIIIDDEAKARNLLTQLCKEYCPNIQVLGQAKNVDDARKMIDDSKSDFIS